jgi:hypothetical protein
MQRHRRNGSKLLVWIAWSVTVVTAGGAIATLASRGTGRASADPSTYSYTDIAGSYGDISKLPAAKQLAIRNQVSQAMPSLTSVPALAPFADSGPTADVAAVKADLLTDVDAWLTAQDEPLTQAARRNNLVNPSNAASRDDRMASAWAGSQRAARVSELESALQSAQGDAGYHPYDDARLSVVAWSGVRVTGNSGFALLTAAPYMHRSCGWVTGATDQWQVDLTRESQTSGSKAWKLVDFKRIDIGLNNRPDPAC